MRWTADGGPTHPDLASLLGHGYICRMQSVRKKLPLSVNPFDPIGSERKLLSVFLVAADKFDHKHGRTKNAARRQMIKEGILTKSGNLTKHYGG